MEFTTFSVSKETQRLEVVQGMALDLMREHGLSDWTLAFDRARHRAGICRRKKREISLSAPLMSVWKDEQIRDTILHEIAHALTKGGHTDEWRAMCVRIGADPTRTWDPTQNESLPTRYTGICPNGHESKRDRRPRNPVSCAVCCPKYDARYLVTWKRNEA